MDENLVSCRNHPLQALSLLQSRPPGIYKQHYLDDLCKRYDDSESLQAPELPEWCLEEEEGSDNEAENGGHENNAGADGSRPDGGRKRQKREFKTGVGFHVLKNVSKWAHF